MHASKTCDQTGQTGQTGQTDSKQQLEPFKQKFNLTLYGKHCTSYTIYERQQAKQLVQPCMSSASQLAELRKKLADNFRQCLPDGLPDGQFWEFNDVWTTKIEFLQPVRERYLTYFPWPFDPNHHLVVTMLADPHEPSFACKVVYCKKLGLVAIQQDMAKLTKSEFVLADQESGKVLDCQAKVAADLVFVACMPKARLLRSCKVNYEHGTCIGGRVGDMRLAIAKLNDWKLADTGAWVIGIGDVSDDYDTTTPGKYVDNPRVQIFHMKGKQAAKERLEKL